VGGDASAVGVVVNYPGAPRAARVKAGRKAVTAQPGLASRKRAAGRISHGVAAAVAR
jgi:hypothetical protein